MIVIPGKAIARGASYAALSCVAASCQASHLLYVHQATLGINVTPPGAEGTGSLVVGYDRETYSIVPRVTPPAVPAALESQPATTGDGVAVGTPTAPEGPKEPDAMSLVALSRMYFVGLGTIDISHVIATGEPAAQVATSEAYLREAAAQVFRGAIAGAPETKEAPSSQPAGGGTP